jgi:hypothetical protein
MFCLGMVEHRFAALTTNPFLIPAQPLYKAHSSNPPNSPIPLTTSNLSQTTRVYPNQVPKPEEKKTKNPTSPP